MNVAEIRTFFGYSRWAHRRLLEAARAVPAEELERDVGGSFGSLLGTLRHLLWGERSWLRFWREGSFAPDLAADELPDLRSIETGWTRLEKEQDAFLGDLTDEKLRARRPVDGDEYVLGELVQHALNHATHHRGQVVLMLRQLGKTPPGTGFRQYLTAIRRGS